MALPGYNPWLLPDPRTQLQLQAPYGPANMGEPSPWDVPKPPMPQSRIDQGFNLRPMAPGSGISNDAGLTQSEDMKRSAQERSTTFLTPEEFMASYESANQMPEIQAQRRAQEQNKELFQMSLRQPATVDLASPLSIAAHNINPKYTLIPPSQSGGMGEKEVREWAKQQQDDQRDLTKTIIDAQKASKSGYYTDQIMQALGIKDVLNAKAQDPNIGRGAGNANSAWLRWTAAFDKSAKPMQDALGEAESLKAALHGPPAAQRNVPILMAKMNVGNQRLAVQEVMMEKGDPSLESRILQAYETLKNGEITPQNKSQYEAFADELVSIHKQALDNKRKQAYARGRPLGLPEHQMNAYLQPSFVNPHTTPEKQKLKRIDINELIKHELSGGGGK